MNNIYRNRIIKDKVFFLYIVTAVILVFIILSSLLAGLVIRAEGMLRAKGLSDILSSSEWVPSRGLFGLLPFIVSSAYITLTAVLLSVPICLLCSIFLVEYAPSKVKYSILSVINVMSGIPSVLFGVWGVVVIVPFIRDKLSPFFNTYSSGFTVLTAGIVLGVMIFPYIIQISVEVIECVPSDLKHASLALGATKWETIKFVTLKKASGGIAAAVILAASRALGETMAVMMVAGNVNIIPKSPLEPAYPITALIANNYGEMMSVPLYDSALMLASLVLLGIVVIFNITGRIILTYIEEGLK